MKFIDRGGIGLTQPLTVIIGYLLMLTTPIKPEAQEEPATLGSMDEQYAWVGDLGDRDALPGKPLYIEHCAGCHEAQVYIDSDTVAVYTTSAGEPCLTRWN